MLSNLKKRNGGFTIIEVLIVLAIAGLILLVVFLAVPALQRNSRNTQAKNAASAVLGAISEYVNNNDSQLPTALSITNGAISVTGTGTASTGKTQGGYTGSVVAAATMPAKTGIFNVALNTKCSSGTAFDTYGSSPRAVAVGFLIETGTGTTATQCVES